MVWNMIQQKSRTRWMTVPVSMRRPPGAAGRGPWATWATGAARACEWEGLFLRGGESGSSAGDTNPCQHSKNKDNGPPSDLPSSIYNLLGAHLPLQ